MLKLRELEMEGFRSFKDSTIIQFPDSGVMLISGKWKDSTTSSGSGKSSIFEAIAFALGYCDRPATALKCWDAKKMKVRLRIADEAHIYDVIRDPKLSLVIDGVPYESTATGAEEKLAEILKTPPELARALTYRPQRKPGMFINSTDSEKKEFLATLLGLDKLEAASDEFSAALRNEEMSIQQANQNLTHMLDFVAQSAVNESDLEKAKRDYEAAKVRYDQVVAGSENAELQQQLLSAQQQLMQINQAKQQVAMARQQGANLKAQIVQLAAEVERLAEHLCYTCNRHWDSAGDELEKKKQLSHSLHAKLKECESIERNAATLLSSEAAVSAEYTRINQAIGQLKAPVQDALNALNIARDTLSRLANAKAASDKAKMRCVELKMSIQASEKRAALLRHAVAVTGRSGFMSEIFDEVLSEIEVRANDLMVYMPNVSTYSMVISSVSSTKAGAIKKTISTKVLRNTGQEVDPKDLSGGQQCSIELSTDLAVAEAIRARSGSPLGWIALDEAMDGLDVEPKKAAIEAIRQKTRGLVIIIDHATEIKESFDSVIQIEYDGKESRVL
jgi:DNA repair exonuclease SbcCD ATPase subunit